MLRRLDLSLSRSVSLIVLDQVSAGLTFLDRRRGQEFCDRKDLNAAKSLNRPHRISSTFNGVV
jgi:hypothetical protein